MTLYADLICEKCRLSTHEREIIKNASLLHDIGKIGIKDSVLQKEGKLTSDEYEHIKEHVRLTHNILSKVYITNNCNPNTVKKYNNIVNFNGDIVISVSADGKTYTVAKKDGSKSTKYTTKTNKKAAEKCALLNK